MIDPSPSRAGPQGPSNPVLPALALSLALGAAYLALQRDSYFGDARMLIGALMEGKWTYYHRACLPAGHLALLVAPSAELALRLVSAVSAACGCGLVFLAARAMGHGWSTATCAALLFAASPAVLFFATTPEAHALTLVTSGLASLWAARARLRHPPWGDALAPLLLLLALVGAHMASALWGVAALLVAFWDGERAAWPRRWRSAAALAVLALVVIALLPPIGHGYGRFALASIRHWSPAMLANELVLRAGLLVPLALAGAFLAWRARGRGLRIWGPPLVSLFLPYLVLVPGLMVVEEGGYYLPLYPVLALLAARALEALRARPWIAALLFAGQAAWGACSLWSFERRYFGHEWIRPLIEDLDGGGVVLTRYAWEWQALNTHAGLDLAAVGPIVGPIRYDLASPQILATVVRHAGQAWATGGDLAITRSLLHATDHGAPVLVAALRERYGEPLPGNRPEYLVFPRP